MMAIPESIPTRPISKATTGAAGHRYLVGWPAEASGHRVRFECHPPAVEDEYEITVTFSTDHLAHPAYSGDPEAGDEFDAPGPSGTNAIANSSVSQPVTLTVVPPP
jgi:hypothetical protein